MFYVKKNYNIYNKELFAIMKSFSIVDIILNSNMKLQLTILIFKLFM